MVLPYQCCWRALTFGILLTQAVVKLSSCADYEPRRMRAASDSDWTLLTNPFPNRAGVAAVEKIDSTASESGKNNDEVSRALSWFRNAYQLTTGTTIVGVCCSDGVVLGADTRSTGGPLVMDKNKLKIHKISRLIYCCGAGTSADCDQVTRAAAASLARLKLDYSISSTSFSSSYDKNIYDDYLDPIPAALSYLCSSVLSPRSSSESLSASCDAFPRLASLSLKIPNTATRHSRDSDDPKSAVMVLGGVDEDGPSLYSIDSDGLACKVTFAAQGSGATDAIAALENWFHARSCNQSHCRSDEISHHGNFVESKSYSTADGTKGALPSTVDAVGAVREAVLAGIMNDLGSGSHIDLCVISRKGVRLWRENSLEGRGQRHGSTIKDSERSSDKGEIGSGKVNQMRSDPGGGARDQVLKRVWVRPKFNIGSRNVLGTPLHQDDVVNVDFI